MYVCMYVWMYVCMYVHMCVNDDHRYGDYGHEVPMLSMVLNSCMSTMPLPSPSTRPIICRHVSTAWLELGSRSRS